MRQISLLRLTYINNLSEAVAANKSCAAPTSTKNPGKKLPGVW